MTTANTVAAALLLGAVVRVVALPSSGTEDLAIRKVWSFGATHDLTGVYGVGDAAPEHPVLRWEKRAALLDHPPLAVEELALVGRLYERAIPSFRESRLLSTAIKLPGLAAEIIFVAAALTWGRRRFGERAAVSTALAFWLNPGVILDGSVLGYIDAQGAVPGAAAVVAAFCGPPWLAGALAAIGVMTKPQIVFVAPAVVGPLLWRRPTAALRALGEAASAAAVVSLALMLPYLLRGAGWNVIQAVKQLATHNMLSGYGANVWWIAGWLFQASDNAGQLGWWSALTQPVQIVRITHVVAVGWPNPRLVGPILVAVSSAWALWQMRHAKTLAAAAAVGGWSVWAYTLFAAYVHENHMYAALPLFAIAAGADRRYRTFFYWTSAIFTLNLLLFYGLGPRFPSPINRRWTAIDASVVLAIVNVAVFVGTYRKFSTSIRSSSDESMRGVVNAV